MFRARSTIHHSASGGFLVSASRAVRPPYAKTDDYSSITSRSFVVPELGITLRFESIDAPEELQPFLNGSQGQEASSIDDVLEEVCQQIFSLPSANVLSFSRWKVISGEIAQFTENIKSTLPKVLAPDEVPGVER